MLVDKGSIELLKKLIQDDKDSMYLAVFVFCDRDMIKDAEKIIKSQKFNISNFPDFSKKKLQKSISFHLNKKPIIFHLIELARDEAISTAVLIELLWASSKSDSWMKNIASYLISLHSDIEKLIDKDIYFKAHKISVEFNPPEDIFGPSNPNFYHLPNDIQVCFIDSIEKAQTISWSDMKIVGLDSEWKTDLGLNGFSPTSILQLATNKFIYLIDLEICCNLEDFDNNLYEIFTDPEILKVGVSFDGDLSRLKQSYPECLSFQIELSGYIDLISVFAGHFKYYPGGLIGLCEILLNEKLCKLEQMSNWNQRPLRKAQAHYAACDSFVCLLIYQKLEDIGANMKVGIEDMPKNMPKKVGDACEGCNSKVHCKSECPQLKRCKVCGRSEHKALNCPCVIVKG